jgi:hypothetical protein
MQAVGPPPDKICADGKRKIQHIHKDEAWKM